MSELMNGDKIFLNLWDMKKMRQFKNTVRGWIKKLNKCEEYSKLGHY